MRTDVQFLRGIAVLFVVIYHSGLQLLPHGYLGVDLFFVLSGFLITKLVLSRLAENSFSFADFYYRRAKRLLPALYCTLLFTTFLSIFFLTQSQLEDFLEQFIGAITFSSNMVLPSQTGYFDSAADGKPLLHIWSLSLEEQYYFLLPVALFFLPNKLRLIGLISATIISLVWCYSWMFSQNQDVPFFWRFSDASKYEWVFYLMPTRAWELLVGSIAAWVYLNKGPIKTPRSLNYFSFLVIFLIGIFNVTPNHPDVEALIIVVFTSILLLSANDWLPDNYLVRVVQRIGDWSYSIYLVHWPIFAFAYVSFVGVVPTYVSILLVFSSIFLGYLQFKFVELPFRYGNADKVFSNWRSIAAVTSILLLIPLGLSSHPLYDEYSEEVSEVRKVNYGMSEECENSFSSRLVLKVECRTSASVDTVVWGDSYAMHLVSGLMINNKNIAQITKSVCGPFLDIAPITKAYNQVWAEGCIDYNNSAMEYILNNNDVRNIVMSSPLHQYLSGSNKILTISGVENASHEILIQSFRKTVSELVKAGKNVIFVSPPPKNGSNLGECLERKYGPILMFREDCSISMEEYLENQAEVLNALKEFSSISRVYDLSEVLCSDGQCRSEINGKFVYRDEGHLSIEGSIELFGGIKITDLLD